MSVENTFRGMGRLGSDITLRTNKAGKAYCYFSIAIDRGRTTDENGNTVDRPPLWLDFSASGARAVYLSTYGKKGFRVIAEGELERRSRTVDKDGQKVIYNDVEVRCTSVKLLDFEERGESDSRQAGHKGTSAPKPQTSAQKGPSPAAQDDYASDFDDDYGYVPDDYDEPSDTPTLNGGQTEQEGSVWKSLPF